MRNHKLSSILLVGGFVIGAGLAAAGTKGSTPKVAAADPSPQALLRGPVLGYVLDSRSQSIRPVNGIPGASHLGSPLVLPFPVLRGAFSSGSDFALVVSGAEDHALYLLRDLGAASPSLNPVDGIISTPDRVILNQVNSAAAVYTAETRRLQIIRGLPENPVAGPILDLSSLSGTVVALALDGGASRVLLATSENGSGALYLVDAAATGQPGPRFLANFAAPSAIALLNHDRDAVVADARLNQLVVIRDFAGSADVFLLAGENDGISNPVGVVASADGRRIFIANAGSRSLEVFDVEGRSVAAKMDLDTAPTRLNPFQVRSTFLLNEVGDDPLLLFDATDDLTVYFVPAGKDE